MFQCVVAAGAFVAAAEAAHRLVNKAEVRADLGGAAPPQLAPASKLPSRPWSCGFVHGQEAEQPLPGTRRAALHVGPCMRATQPTRWPGRVPLIAPPAAHPPLPAAREGLKRRPPREAAHLAAAGGPARLPAALTTAAVQLRAGRGPTARPPALPCAGRLLAPTLPTARAAGSASPDPFLTVFSLPVLLFQPLLPLPSPDPPRLRTRARFCALNS